MDARTLGLALRIARPLLFAIVVAGAITAIVFGREPGGVAEAVAPPNDNVASPELVDHFRYGTEASFVGATTVDATMEGGEPSPSLPCLLGGEGVGYSVWFTFTPPVTGRFQLDTIGSSFDTVIDVRDTSTGFGNELGCDDQGGGSSTSLLNMTLTGGVTYRVRVSAWDPPGAGTPFPGPLALHIDLQQIVVTSNNDVNDGTCNPAHCSLREAIILSNTMAELKRITFDIAPGGLQTIAPTSILPDITAPVRIMGATQPTGPIGGEHRIILSGISSGAGYALRLVSDGNMITRMVIAGFTGGYGIRIDSANNVIQNNKIGTNAAGIVSSSVVAEGACAGAADDDSDDRINDGCATVGPAETGTQCLNAVDDDGDVSVNDGCPTAGTANSIGIYIPGGEDNAIGGTTEKMGNVIGGNTLFGVLVYGCGTGSADGNVIEQNYIGRSRLGDPMPNSSAASPQAAVGFGCASDNEVNSNTIAGNTDFGVGADGSLTPIAVGNTFSKNSMEGNDGAGGGIELVGVANNLIAPPSITGVTATSVSGTACALCEVEVFFSPTLDCEGRDYWRSAKASAGGVWSLTNAKPTGRYLTATSTDASGDTSEFSACVAGAAPSSTSLTFNPIVKVGLTCYYPACASGISLSMMSPQGSLAARELHVLMAGTWFDGGTPVIGTEIARVIQARAGCHNGNYIIAGTGGPTSPIPIRFADSSGASSWYAADVLAALQIDAAEIRGYRADGSLIPYVPTGIAKMFIVDNNNGTWRLEGAALGASIGGVACSYASLEIKVDAEAGGFTVFRTPALEGLYPAVALAQPFTDPEQSPPDWTLEGEGAVGYVCTYIGSPIPGPGARDIDQQASIQMPGIGDDTDGDCRADTAAGFPGGVSESTANDELPDLDGDGLPDGVEDMCGTNAGSLDSNGDGKGDREACMDLDSIAPADGDGIGAEVDNCPIASNASQADLDFDGEGDVCDRDDDNDLVPDTLELTMEVNLVPDDAGTIGISERAWRCDYAGAATLLLSPSDPDSDNDMASDLWDCFGADPGNASSFPEICDGADNDLDGDIDERPIDFQRAFVLGSCSDADGDTLMQATTGVIGGSATRGFGDEDIALCWAINGAGPQPEPPTDVATCSDSPGSDYDNDHDGSGGVAALDYDDDNDFLGDGFEVRLYLTSPANVNTDGDACSDYEEVATLNPDFGGARDPNNRWDFYDVPVPAIGSGGPPPALNRVVTIADVLAVLYYSSTVNNGGPNVNGVDYDTIAPAPFPADDVGRLYDRRESAIPTELWRSRPPTGAIGIQDAIVALAQVGDSCTAPPN